jgi:hypothetical protein
MGLLLVTTLTLVWRQRHGRSGAPPLEPGASALAPP